MKFQLLMLHALQGHRLELELERVRLTKVPVGEAAGRPGEGNLTLRGGAIDNFSPHEQLPCTVLQKRGRGDLGIVPAPCVVSEVSAGADSIPRIVSRERIGLEIYVVNSIITIYFTPTHEQHSYISCHAFKTFEAYIHICTHTQERLKRGLTVRSHQSLQRGQVLDKRLVPM